ncbi:MAG: Smr/MutS family protein [Acetobacteraceae bacterium]|nr:Smr/MutS family protein [Acetobacteraceae bacterium]
MRRRELSPEERAFWQDWARRAGVVPLAGPLPPEPPPAAAAPAAAAPAAPVPPPRPAPPPPPAEIVIGVQPAGLDAKRWTALRRGRLRPERTLDLHGMRAAEAHAAVRAFVPLAQEAGFRCIAIVTGKGSSPEGGVLRRELPHWLNAPDLRPRILAAAHPHAANTGAVHLLLRRRG